MATLLFYAVAGWLALGTFGTVVSLVRGRRAEALRHGAWVAMVAGAYLLILIGVFQFQQQKSVALGQDQCFGQICVLVTGVEETPGLIAGSPDRVVRLQIVVANRGSAADEDSSLTAYLVDARGRKWEALPGVSGNRLGLRIPGATQILSQPMFQVANDATGLRLILTHGGWHMKRFLLGDPESLGHRPTVVELGR